ncbi:hypothetical protein A2609_02775 [Candidatus Kaiserbacteria bacterium RIFOXYD1_FULL_47_14]|uniref:Uncharacterized protein n=1 Tax=Candidatus Kaiserbacteria bacterium RIFOXYD1_FULL_47_14 TaxID=1798533 RepID=A0A1F6G7Y1_9BACT|nr:MAG: hypothetical protein A2609_02775 [Candidatus Kaiserbacteria bacterium RIFOXYD1_FULL_47_14]
MIATSSIAQASAIATNTAMSVWAVANDFLIVLILLATFFLFAWYVGRGPFVALLIALYAAYAPYSIFPYISFLPTTPLLMAFLAHVGLYTAFVLVFFLILRRVIVSDFLYIGLFGLVILSFLGAAFLIALASNVFLIAPIYHFTPAISALFPTQYFFWWFAAPAVGLLFLAR